MYNISDIDKNFRVDTSLQLEDVTYYNVKENAWCLYGLSFDERFRRMPLDIAQRTNEGVLILHTNTAGGRVRFVTDSPYVSIIAKMPDKVVFQHMPQTAVSGFDVYVNGRFRGALVPPEGMENGYSAVCRFENNDPKNITINFPLYNNVCELYIGLQQGAVFERAAAYTCDQDLVFYGSSITQGACASRPGMAYPAIVAHQLDCDYVNLGFSSSARGEQIAAEYIAGLNPSIFIMDYDYNAPDTEHLKKTHEVFYKTFRSMCPETPIVMISAPNFKFQSTYFNERRKVVKATYENAIKNGDKNVWFIDGEELWGEEYWDCCSVDTIHPNDLGNFRMAQAVIEVVREIMDR